jgi:hypothetical protein
MAYKVILGNIGREKWEKLASQFDDYSIYQTWAYQQVRVEGKGQNLSRVVILDGNNNVVTMCHVRISKIWPIGLRVGYVQGGPLFRRKENYIKCTADALRELHDVYIPHKVDVLRLAPNVRDDEIGRSFAEMLQLSGFELIKAIKPYRTIAMRADRSEDEIMKGLRKSFRRDVRYAQKAGVETRDGTGEEFCRIIEELYLVVKGRKGFKGLDPAEFTKTQRLLSAAEKINIIVAYHKGEPVAAHMASNLGDTSVVLLAASNEKGYTCFASYLVWWRGAVSAHRAGMKWYDLGGIDPGKVPGVSRFKLRMGGTEYYHIGLFAAYRNWGVRKIWRNAELLYSLVKT